MRKHLFVLFLAFLSFSNLCKGQEMSYEEMEAAVIEKCKSSLLAWNDAFNNHDNEALNTLYYDVVHYYQSYCKKEDIRKNHEFLFKKHLFYHQRCEQIEVEYNNDCQVKLTFTRYVQTEKDEEPQVYQSYIIFLAYMNNSYQTKAWIIEESDSVADADIENFELVRVTNETPLDEIFCEANVGKLLDVAYWDLVGFEADAEEGPLASMISESTGYHPHSYIQDIIQKNYKEQEGTYYCGGFFVSGPCRVPVIFVCRPSTKKTWCIGGDEE